MEDIANVEDIIRDDESPPFGRTGRDGERDLRLPSGECNGEVHSVLRDAAGVTYPGVLGAPAAGR
jgi:hypothetical protein